MKILFTLMAISAVACTDAKAQSKNDSKTKPPIIATVDQLAITVVNLRRPINATEEKVGTGSFISKGNDIYI